MPTMDNATITIIASVAGVVITTGAAVATAVLAATWKMISAAETRLKADISAVETRLKADISAVKADLEADISAVKADLEADISGVKADLAQVKKDVLREVDVLHSYMLAGGMRSHAEQISPDRANRETRPKKDEAAPRTASPQPARKAHAT